MEFRDGILGIDAAWTTHRPSGVALLGKGNRVYKCLIVAPSYEDFISASKGREIDWTRSPKGSMPHPRGLLEAARVKLGAACVSCVCVDMPLSYAVIRGYREADRETSRRYGGYGCSVHTPNTTRPGLISVRVRTGFARCGYKLATRSMRSKSCELLEVYPHPAILHLLKLSYRLPYKNGKADRNERLTNMMRVLSELSKQIEDIPNVLLENNSMDRIPVKMREDAMDALVCAWVGIQHLDHKTEPYGNEEAAIWIPELGKLPRPTQSN